MTTATTSAPAARTGLRAAWNRIADTLERWIGHSLLALAAALAIAFLFSRSVSRPVEELRDVAQALADGDLAAAGWGADLHSGERWKA